jgi:hypothetical protein
VPPGRYWPAGAAIRTVAAVDGAAGAELTLAVAAGAGMGAAAGAIPYRSGSPLVAAIGADAGATAGDVAALAISELGALAAGELVATWSTADMFEFGGAPADSGASGIIEYRSGSFPVDGVNAP